MKRTIYFNVGGERSVTMSPWDGASISDDRVVAWIQELVEQAIRDKEPEVKYYISGDTMVVVHPEWHGEDVNVSVYVATPRASGYVSRTVEWVDGHGTYGTEGQDRKGYSDDQDRDDYSGTYDEYEAF